MGESGLPRNVASAAVPRPRKHREYEAGDLIAEKYRLVRTLGEGGMATVWVATHIALDIHVAVKLIRSDIASAGASKRLLQEARAGASIDHPAIIRVFDFGTTQSGDPYIVMELLDGECLADLLQRRVRVAAIKAVQTLLPIAEALAAAHAKGVVHRDLKPENIFLHSSESGRTQPKVLDFGIARLQSAIHHNLTAAGSVLGSPAYMSPEQARGDENVDHRADIWSFSVVLYEMIAGAPPFDAANYNALLHKILEDDPAPTTDLAAGDAELWGILQRGLVKNRDDRWRSMRRMGAALARWLVDREVDEDICGGKLDSIWLGPSDSGERLVISTGSSPDGVRKSIPDAWFDDQERLVAASGADPLSSAFATTAEAPSAPRLKALLSKTGHISSEAPAIETHQSYLTPGSLAPVDTQSNLRASAAPKPHRTMRIALGAVALCSVLAVGLMVWLRSSAAERSTTTGLTGSTTVAQPDVAPDPVAVAPQTPSAALSVEPAPSATAPTSVVPEAGAPAVRTVKTPPPAASGAKEKRVAPAATPGGDDLKLPY